MTDGRRGAPIPIPLSRMFSSARSRSGIAALALLSITFVSLFVLHEARGDDAAIVSSAPLVDFPPVPSEESVVQEGDIAFYTRRVAEDRQSAADRLTLARLLFMRSRSSSSERDLGRAEMLVRESIALRQRRNGPAFELLAGILMARHAFRDAYVVAAAIDSLEPGQASHLALLGEVELELGRYGQAAEHFRAVRTDGRQFTTDARLARWYELTGRVAAARAMMRHAITGIDQRDDLPREQRAWFHYRLGELELRVGRYAAADSAFQEALHRSPDDVRALSGLARTALARGDFSRAVSYGEQAIGLQLDPATLATLSRAHAAMGDSVRAAQYGTAMSLTVLSQPGAIHRAWGLHLLDHGTPSERAEVLRRARAELRERSDVYGHDLLAWALFRAGRHEEAEGEMRLALAQGTEDLLLQQHARKIFGLR